MAHAEIITVNAINQRYRLIEVGCRRNSEHRIEYGLITPAGTDIYDAEALEAALRHAKARFLNAETSGA